jgi:hypothetical protein
LRIYGEKNNCSTPADILPLGMDPIVYTKQFVGDAGVRSLKATPDWKWLNDRMKKSLVLVCEAGVGWLIDDGIRLMPKDGTEWMEFHHIFCGALYDAQIEYIIVPNTLVDRKARVEFAYERWRKLAEG